MPEDMGWWAISGAQLMQMLRDVASGADPEWVYMTAYANAEDHVVNDDDEEWDD